MRRIAFGLILITSVLQAAPAEYSAWKHSGVICLLTTPDGANLPASATEDNFPVLVRLDKDWFNFSDAKAKGDDLRFASATGAPLPYQIEQWDAFDGKAAIWVRVPNIKGNARQEIRMYWGKPDAAGESCGPAVFNESNGYVSVLHMSDPVTDEVGTIVAKDEGTTAAHGMIGPARHLAEKHGISGGENITNYPSGTGPMSTEAWFRAEKPNSTVLAWGKEKRPCKIMMNFLSPPRIAIQCYFADVEAKSPLAMNQWYHVVHTYSNKDSRVYINGRLDGASTPVLDIPTTSSLWIGGWYNNYQFVGDIDEVRISKVVRSPDWIKLQYENQQPLQTLVGPLVQPGGDFSVTPAQVTVPEGRNAVLSAKAGGALKVYWTLKTDGRETLLAVDRFRLTFNAGRLTSDKAATLQFKAIYPNEVKTRDIPVTLKEAVPEPVFTLKAPANWDGRERIEVIPQIANMREMQAAGAGELKYQWDISGIATAREIEPGKLVLTRAQNSGTMTVTATVDNGGKPALQSVKVLVKEPAKDAWVRRTPDKDEKPVDNQFIARDDTNEGTLYYNGTISEPAESVFLKVYADDKLIKTESQPPKADKSYAFAVKLKAGLVKYKVQLGARNGKTETVLNTVSNIVCGDAYMIDGQSNALATDWGQGDLLDTSEWIRSFGANGGDVSKGWGNAVRRQGGHWQIGCWAMDLALRLVESQKVPICIINGAAGGTLIEVHLRNDANPADPQTIYGRLLNRIQQARLTHGIRGVFWHQGENNQGTQGATGRYGWETYEQYFVDMSAAWKRDYPNIQHYYVFQIWPNSCGMGGNRESDKLRDVQRTLPRLYSHMSVMATIGVRPPGPCHFPTAGYADMARIVWPMVQRYNYGKAFDKPVTPADVKKAYYTSARKDEIVLEFDQPVAWTDSLASQFYLDDAANQVASGKAAGSAITLKLKAPSAAGTITYLKDNAWSVDNLLYGRNGLAALTFCDVPITAAK